jgi:hypothetical protein
MSVNPAAARRACSSLMQINAQLLEASQKEQPMGC